MQQEKSLSSVLMLIGISLLFFFLVCAIFCTISSWNIFRPYLRCVISPCCMSILMA